MIPLASFTNPPTRFTNQMTKSLTLLSISLALAACFTTGALADSGAHFTRIDPVFPTDDPTDNPPGDAPSIFDLIFLSAGNVGSLEGKDIFPTNENTTHQAQIKAGCLHVIGTADDSVLALRLRAGDPSTLEIDIGNDTTADFSFNRASFASIFIDARGGDDVVFIDEANGAFTDTELTTIHGGKGRDTIIGGSGPEVVEGGPGDDTLFLGPGADRFVWNPGHGTDIVEGSDGFDSVEINGAAVDEVFTVTANGTRVRFDRLGAAAFFLDLGACESLTLNARGGNDSFACTGNLAALIQITADGGPGNDTLLGSNGPDLLIGDEGNDFIDGQQGTDTALLGAGNDTFQWDPGDGNDIVEGQADNDTILFNGSNGAEIFDFSANGARLRFTRNIANIVLDAAGIEKFDLRALGSADVINVNNLAGAGLESVNIDLASTLGGSTGDTQVDTVAVIGSPAADTFDLFRDGPFIVADGAAAVRVKGYEGLDQVLFTGVGGDNVRVNGSPESDTIAVTANGTQARVDITGASIGVGVTGALALRINGNDGPDTVSCVGNLSAIVPITIDGGRGDDTILGSNGPDLLIGGDGEDFIDGQQGADIALLGAGDDVFQWDPGDGNDIVEGQADNDSILFNGSNTGEIFDFSANGARLRFTRNIGTIILDAAGIEQFDLRALGSADTINVSDLTATDLVDVNIDLASTIGGSAPDAQADSVFLLGSSGADNFDFHADAGFTVADLGTAIRVKGYEALDQVLVTGVGGDRVNVNGTDGPDTIAVTANGTQARIDAPGFSAAVGINGALTLTVNVLGGPDTVSCVGNLSAIVPITIDGGPGDDTLLGSNGPDLLIGGEGNDFIDGQQGVDTALLGAGDDTFQWDPGDGSDIVEGQADNDTILFNGSNAAEIFDFSANGQRLRFTRNIAAIVLDAAGIERFDLRALGSADTINVNDLTATDLVDVNIDLASTIGGSTGDDQPDVITVNGTPSPDAIHAGVESGSVKVSAPFGFVRVARSQPTSDSLVLNGLAGIDTITSDPGVLSLILLTINQ